MSLLQNETFLSLNQRYLTIIYNRWFNLISFLLLTLMLLTTLACFVADFYLHYQLLFLCGKALFSFLTVSLFLILAYCFFHMARIVMMFRERGANNANTHSRIPWFTNRSRVKVRIEEGGVKGRV